MAQAPAWNGGIRVRLRMEATLDLGPKGHGRRWHEIVTRAWALEYVC